MNEFIRPNWHVIFIHYPLGLLIVGVLIETFSFLWKRSGFRQAGRWMILLGTLSMIPATMTGMYALQDVVVQTSPGSDGAPWHETLTGSSITAEQFKTLQWHVWLQVAAAAVSLVAVVSWVGASDRWRDKLYYPNLLLLLIAVGLTVGGAWFGGESVYRDGVGVATADSSDVAVDDAAGLRAIGERAAFFMPPKQLHITLAGFAMAIAAAAIALSFRAAAVAREVPRMPAEGEMQVDQQVDSLVRSINADVMLRGPIERVPAARFWLLCALLFVLTALTGVWYLARDADAWTFQDLQGFITDPDTPRRLWHTALGTSTLVLTLALAAMARWAPRRCGWLTVVATLLILVVAAQIWMGALLLYDSPVGSVVHITEP